MNENTGINDRLHGRDELSSSSMSSKNMDLPERLISAGAGALITLSAITKLFKNPVLALTQIGVGAMLLDRGISGYCIVRGPDIKAKNERTGPTEPAPLSTAETNTQSIVIDAIELGSGSNTKRI